MISHRLTPLTESGILAALSVVLGLMALFLPVLGVVAVFLWALPLLVLVVRQGVRFGVAAAVAASAVLSLFAGPLLALRMCVAFAPVGLVLGWGIGRGWSGVRTFLAGLAASVASKLLAFLLLFFLMGIDPWQNIIVVLNGSKESKSVTIPAGDYRVVACDGSIDEQSQETLQGGSVTVDPQSALILRK